MKRLLLIVFLSATAAAQIDIRPTFALQPDAPLEIVGIMHTMRDLVSRVDVHNNSSRIVVAFQLGWITAVPEGCAETSVARKVNFAEPDERVIQPGETVQSLSYRIGGMRTLQLAKSLGAKHLWLQFGIVYVKFQDGTSWKHDLRKTESFGNDVELQEFSCNPKPTAFGSKSSGSCGKVFTLRGLSDEAPKGARLSRVAQSGPDCCGNFCEWNCQATSNFKNCAVVRNPAPGCAQDDLGQCCFESISCGDSVPCRVCAVRCF